MSSLFNDDPDGYGDSGFCATVIWAWLYLIGGSLLIWGLCSL